MISWTKHSDNDWEFKYKDKTYPLNNLAEIVAASVFVEIPEEEIKEAIMAMDEHNHNFAQFGIKKTFIYTDKV